MRCPPADPAVASALDPFHDRGLLSAIFVSNQPRSCKRPCQRPEARHGRKRARPEAGPAGSGAGRKRGRRGASPAPGRIGADGAMDLPVTLPVASMLAKALNELPGAPL